jgi:hypothetical protein
LHWADYWAKTEIRELAVISAQIKVRFSPFVVFILFYFIIVFQFEFYFGFQILVHMRRSRTQYEMTPCFIFLLFFLFVNHLIKRF